MDSGWSPAAAVALRVSIAAVVLIVPGLMAVRGRTNLLLANARTIVIYGLLAWPAHNCCTSWLSPASMSVWRCSSNTPPGGSRSVDVGRSRPSGRAR